MRTYQSINKELVAALRPILPVAHLEYPDGGKEYATFDVTVMQATHHASGDNHAIRCHGYVDVFTEYDPASADSVLGRIDAALNDAGFSVTSIGGTQYIREMRKYHTEVTFQKVVEWGEDA